MDAFLAAYQPIIASVSGQAFFLVGLLAAWERRHSRVALARPLWMLAAFGLLYAFAEWGRLFIPIQAQFMPALTDLLWLLRVLFMAAAFGALLQFGIELLPPRSRRRLRPLPALLFVVWLGMSLGGANSVRDVGMALTIAEIQARILMALPAGLVGALGLLVQVRYLRIIGGQDLARWAQVSAGSSVLTGLTLGALLPGFGSWAGTEALVGVPAEIWRALAGGLLALGLSRTLAVSELEQDRAIEDAERRAIASQARERLARELSDGVIQRLYAVGLLLGQTAHGLPPDDPVHRALKELDASIEALRETLMRAPPPDS